MSIKQNQLGGSAFGLIITLALLAYGAYVGIQYIPQQIESRTMTGILDAVEGMHRKERFSDATAVRTALDKQLYINGVTDRKDDFDVTSNGNRYTITVSYDRELNLLFTVKTMHYKKSVTLQ
jgi:hypothetical protein